MSSRRFVPYRPAVHGARPPNALIIREATLDDVTAIVQTVEERQGMHVEGFSDAIRGEIYAEEALVLVAEVSGRFAGYGRVAFFAPPANAPENCAPQGWYLTGLVVRPRLRRRGIGLELTRRRLDWVRTRSREAFYFANARNRASFDLHARLGFVEVTRAFWFPRVSFIGGAGVLCRVELQ